MKKYTTSDNDLEALDIKTKVLHQITNKETIHKYDQALLAGESLPKNVIKNKVGVKELDDSRFIENLDALPENITKEPKKITDEKELDKIKQLNRENYKLPNNIMKKYTDNGYRYYYLDKYDYYQDINEYYDVEYLDDANIDAQIQVENLKSFKSISSSLLFFKYVVIALLSISLIFFMIMFSAV